jgi:hypothetical protein
MLSFGRDGLMVFAACANTDVSMEVRYLIGNYAACYVFLPVVRLEHLDVHLLHLL